MHYTHLAEGAREEAFVEARDSGVHVLFAR
jgi:hypothetical protein